MADERSQNDTTALVNEAVHAPSIDVPVEARAAAEKQVANRPVVKEGRFVRFMPHSILATVDEDGYLLPIMTNVDLLRALKAVWRAELK